jgi:hypothetical protein
MKKKLKKRKSVSGSYALKPLKKPVMLQCYLNECSQCQCSFTGCVAQCKC